MRNSLVLTNNSMNHSNELEKYTLISFKSEDKVRKWKIVEEILDSTHKNLSNYFSMEESVLNGYFIVVRHFL